MRLLFLSTILGMSCRSEFLGKFMADKNRIAAAFYSEIYK